MLNITTSQVTESPFPHIVTDNILEPTFYSALRADFPTSDIFEGQKESTGLTGSRTGQGFDIYRGDSSYDRLIKSSEAWEEFDRWINSTEFVNKFLEIFSTYLGEIGCRATINPEKYDRTLIEGREGLTVRPTLKERIGSLGKTFLPHRSLGEVALFSRLDIHKALKGYHKEVHCDRANRLCSLIIYFVDSEKEGIEGGELSIHTHKEKKNFSEYERHPKPKDAASVATLTPKENMGVIFPCCNNSYHSVSSMKSNGKERDYLYINISGDVNSLW